MKRTWTPDELIEQWTLQPNEQELIAYKEGANRLGFALLLKSFQIDGRFPRQKHDVPIAAVVFVAEQVDVPIDRYPAYNWFGRTINQHRADIRSFLGVRESTIQDAKEVTTWPVSHALPQDHQLEHLKVTAYTRFRELQLEPPTPDRMEWLVRSALRTYEQQFCAAIHAKLTPQTLLQMDALLRTAADTGQESDAENDGVFVRSAFHELKLDPGPLTLGSVLTESGKLIRIRQLGMPLSLFADVPPKVLQHYRQRAATEPPRELCRHPDAVRATLLTTYTHLRGPAAKPICSFNWLKWLSIIPMVS